METGESLFSNSYRRDQNGNNSNSWDIWDLGTSRFVWNNPSLNQEDTTTTTTTSAGVITSEARTLMFAHEGNNAHPNLSQNPLPSLYAGGASHLHPDPHLTCLKLGKRHYFEDATPLCDRNEAVGFPLGKRRPFGGGDVEGRSSSPPASSAVARYGSPAMVPRCQVEGCHVALMNAKDYHRRHKVCEMHSKAPKVVVLGMEQRFCQQCSRFHVVSEFDDSKRSCRRRLAGHNERRRKSSTDSITRNPSQESRSTGGRFSRIPTSTGCALSLLSSKTTSWVSTDDLSSHSSAALRELIAENRAAILAKQLFSDRGWNHPSDDLSDTQLGFLSNVPHQQVFSESPQWDRFQESREQVTLDLMQAPNSPFGFLSGRTKSKEEEEVCCEIWKSLESTHVV